MHAHTQLGHPACSQADGPLDHLIETVAACELPTVEHLRRRARRQYQQRPCWKSILRRLIKETSIP
jgi:hypothetical protein